MPGDIQESNLFFQSVNEVQWECKKDTFTWFAEVPTNRFDHIDRFLKCLLVANDGEDRFVAGFSLLQNLLDDSNRRHLCLTFQQNPPHAYAVQDGSSSYPNFYELLQQSRKELSLLQNID